MPSIKNMTMLRNKVLQAYDDLENGKIDISEASIISKLCDSVVGSLKSEMQYAILTNQQPQIPFYGEGSGALLIDVPVKKLPLDR